MSYSTEAILWGAWIKQNMADQLPVTVAALVMENDFGLSYQGGMEDYAEANPDVIAEFIPVRHEPAAPTVTNEMTTIMASNPDVFLAMTSGNACLLAVEESGRNGMSDTGIPRFVSSTCKDPNAYMIPAGDAADQFRIVGGGQKINTDPQYADDVYVQWANGVLEEAGLDTSIGLYFTGLVFGWPHVEALRVANELPGGLTRTNFMLAMRSLDLNHGGFVDGITFKVNGNEDAYYIEGSDFSIYDAANQSWIEEGGVVNLDGSSPNCAWTSEGC